MDIKEYLSVRRAYNVVRQMVVPRERLTFEEFAILCRLSMTGEALKTSAIAEYQGALRPTMTHRTNHLAQLGFIDREKGEEDRRNVVCAITDDGRAELVRLADLTRSQIPTGKALSRTSAERIVKYGDAMGSVYFKASQLVLMGVYASENETLSIMQIVDSLGLLQPTVSMSVANLADEGLVVRSRGEQGSRTTTVKLTREGSKVARGYVETIEQLVVRRKIRGVRPETGEPVEASEVSESVEAAEEN